MTSPPKKQIGPPPPGSEAAAPRGAPQVVLRWLKLTAISVAGGLVLSLLLVIHFQEYLWLPALRAGPIDYTLPAGFAEEMLKTEDGERITLWHHDADPAVKKGAILMFHGNGDLLPRSRILATLFGGLGFSTYEIDYRGTGKSSGWPTEAGLHADAEAAWGFAARREGGGADLRLAGFSFGTGLATYLAQRHDASCLLLIGAYLSIPDVMADRWDEDLLRPFSRVRLPTREIIQHMGRTKILAIHGTDDPVIEAHHARDLARLYGGHGFFRLLLVKGAGHYDVLGAADDAIRGWALRCDLTFGPAPALPAQVPRTFP